MCVRVCVRERGWVGVDLGLWPRKKRCRHAAVPNFSEFDRCLLYSVYGPKGISDEPWMHCSPERTKKRIFVTQKRDRV